MTKFFLALACVTCFSLPAQAAPSPFLHLQPGDVPATDCGTFIHDRGKEPSASNMRLFMSTDQVLYLRTIEGVRTLKLDQVTRKMRDPDILGRGDQVTLLFKSAGKERALLEGKVREAVIDDDGLYPAIEIDARVTYTSPAGKQLRQQLLAYDACL